MKILIADKFGKDYVSRQAGERLRKIISGCSDTKIILDFKGLVIASASFFDEGIAKLVQEGWTSTDISKKITIQNIHPMDQKLLVQVCLAREIDIT